LGNPEPELKEKLGKTQPQGKQKQKDLGARSSTQVQGKVG
jgi:hypothetical protein